MLKVALPSDSLLRRHHVTLDVAMLLLARKAAAKQSAVSRYCMIDSSPLGGFDWVWSQYTEIANDKLVETFDAVCCLSRSVRTCIDRLLAEEDDESGQATFQQQLRDTPYLPEWSP
eukprot:10765484-Lingulodinium_polyedra.AAC.1